MNKRYLAVGIMLALAFTLWFIATARADATGYYQLSDWALILIGLLFGIGAFPVSGDLENEIDESEDMMSDRYDVTLEVTEQGLGGSYTSQPHTYRKCYSSVEAAKSGFEELLWECIEVEGITSGRVLVECSIEKNGIYFDNDESELEICVEYTDKPSHYFVNTGRSTPRSVNRAKSTYSIV